MPGISTVVANEVLARHRFQLSKGDVRSVAESAKSQSEKDLIAAATALGIERRYKNSSLNRLRREQERNHPLRPLAVRWIAERAAVALENPDIIERVVSGLVTEAMDGASAIVEYPSRDPWPRIRDTGAPHDLSRWDTLGEFMREPVSNVSPTFEREWGFCATTTGDVRIPELMEVVHDVLRKIARDAKSQAPDEIAAWISGLGKAAIDQLAIDDAYAALCSADAGEWQLHERIEKMPFRESLLHWRPDARERLERDLAAKERRLVERQRIQERVAPMAACIKARFDGRKITHAAVFEVANAVMEYVRDPEWVELSQALFQHELIRSALNKSAQLSLREMGLEWRRQVGDRPDFSRPLVQLFVAMDDAWRQDGRQWQVVVVQDGFARAYGRKNWIFLLAHALDGGYRSGSRRNVVVRRFEQPGDHIWNSLRTISGIWIAGEACGDLSEAETRSISSTTRLESGKKAATAEQNARHVSIGDLCPAFVAGGGSVESAERTENLD